MNYKAFAWAAVLLARTLLAQDNSGSSQAIKVFVEPWQTLVRDTNVVSAGKALQYNFTLESGTILSAEFQVHGGLNNALQVYLMCLGSA